MSVKPSNFQVKVFQHVQNRKMLKNHRANFANTIFRNKIVVRSFLYLYRLAVAPTERALEAFKGTGISRKIIRIRKKSFFQILSKCYTLGRNAQIFLCF